MPTKDLWAGTGWKRSDADTVADLVDDLMAPGTSTPTAAGTTTLTSTSRQVQAFTGTANQTVVLPTTSIGFGRPFTIINNSTGVLTVQSSNGNTVATVAANTLQLFVAQVSTPTTSAHWRAI